MSSKSPSFASPSLASTHSTHPNSLLCVTPRTKFHTVPNHTRRRPHPLWRSEASHEPTTEPTSIPTPSPQSTSSATYSVQSLTSVTELSSTEWDSFACVGTASPFLRHFWLRCLETSGCAAPDTGWTPHHILVKDTETDQIVALAPAYMKTHSMGEFVFDHDWADACYGAGMPYYPKLLLAVPFTPATGRRVLTKEGIPGSNRKKILDVVAKALKQMVDVLKISSVHVNFCEQDEVQALSHAGFLQRKGVQYHFTNYKKGREVIADLERRVDERSNVEGYVGVEEGKRVPYRDFEDYLSEFKSKRRIKMRRERNVVRDDSGLEVIIKRGDDLDESIMETMFDIYKSTIDKQFYGRQYLTKRFFRMLAECDDFKRNICLVLAKRKGTDDIVGGTFNVIGDGDGGAFYGRYWGCTEEVKYLHFETCYYATIEYCIQNGLARMEPGAGGGDQKYIRGFEPAITNSMHYLRDGRLSDAVERYLQIESLQVDYAVQQMTEVSGIRAKADKTSSNGNGSGQ